MNAYEKYNPPGRSIPKSLAPLVARLEFDPPPGILTTGSLAELAAVPEATARVMASRLVNAGWLERVSRGRYRFIPAAMAYPRPAPWPLLAASHTRYLVSGLTAARLHRLTSQIPSRHVVMFSRDKSPPREVARSPAFRVVRFRPDRIYGGEEREMDDVVITFARIERVMVDAAMQPGWVDGAEEMARILRRAFATADLAVLVDFVARYRSDRLARRMGWWGDRLLPGGWPEEWRAQLRGLLSPSPGGTLIPGGPRSGPFDPRWGVYVNTPPEVIDQAEQVR